MSAGVPFAAQEAPLALSRAERADFEAGAAPPAEETSAIGRVRTGSADRPISNQDAMDFWRDKVPMTSKEYAALKEEARSRAFFVSGLAKGDVLDAVKESLRKAVAEGRSFAAWKKDIGPELERAGWIGVSPHRLETIFRNNVQSAYMAGRYTQMKKTVALRPYWQLVAVMDMMTRPDHAALHEIVYPAEHAFWDTYYPPNGHRCRCAVISLSERQVESRGIKVETEIDHLREHPDFGLVNTLPRNGFDRNVGKDWWASARMVADKEKHPEAYAEALKHPPADAQRPVPVKSYAELGKDIEGRAGEFMRHAHPVTVDFKQRRSFLSTDCYGKITVSQKTHTLRNGTFNAAKELKDAWNALAKGKPLTWNQEYAVEGLWHEIMHNRQIVTRMRNGSPRDKLMETVNQWLSRRTYPEFLRKMGGQPSHQADILKNGLGYQSYVRNFDRLLSRLQLKDGDILAGVRNMHETVRWDSYAEHLEKMLAKKCPGLSPMRLQHALLRMDAEEGRFQELLDALVEE